MNDQQLEDLKQFIDGRIGQFESSIEDRLNGIEGKINGVETKLLQKIENLRQEMLDGFTGVGEAIDEINRRIDEYLVKA